jgi:hypothetical protein
MVGESLMSELSILGHRREEIQDILVEEGDSRIIIHRRNSLHVSLNDR